MSLDRALLVFAGTMVLLSVLLTQFVSPYFVWFTVFIGVNLIQSAFTRWCLMEDILKALDRRKTGAEPAA